jgi:hypothetical protein
VLFKNIVCILALLSLATGLATFQKIGQFFSNLLVTMVKAQVDGATLRITTFSLAINKSRQSVRHLAQRHSAQRHSAQRHSAQ